MDNSATYIQMCKEAQEIQEIMPNGKFADHFEEACFYHNPKGGTQVLEYPDFPDGSVWLPRQDQLEGMIENKLGIWAKFGAFGCYCNSWGGESGKYDTGEQLWLGFVMAEKYNKVWDGKNWVSQGEK